MKKSIYFLTTLTMMALLNGCNTSTSETSESLEADVTSNVEVVTPTPTLEPTPEPLDLVGTWKQTNSKSEDSYQEAIISSDTIEIFWVSDGGDTKSLYWSGSYIAPTENVKSYSWDSVNNHEKTDSALMASEDDTKTITYEDGEISYTTSIMGTTSVIRLNKE